MKKTIVLLFAAVIFLFSGCNSGYGVKEDNVMELFGCTAFSLDEKMTDTDVTNLYLKETEKGKAENYTPVILALDRRVREMEDTNVSEFESPEEFRKSVLSDTEGGKDLLERQYAELKAVYAEYGEEEETFAENDEMLDLYIRTIGARRQDTLWSVKDSADMLIDGEGVYLVRIPTANPWEAAAWLPFCGWNECPSVAEMVKICRFWYEEYGAAPAFISGDQMRFWLDKPIRDRQTAREISHQHAAFCSEFLGMAGLDAQAADIMTSNLWTFWWD